MGRSIENRIEITHKGEWVFLKVLKPLPDDAPLPFSKLTEYLQSLKFLEINFSSVKKAYRGSGNEPVQIARRPIGFGFTSRFKLEISDDKMTCWFILLPPRDKEEMTMLDIVIGEMKKQNVTYGIKANNIQNAIDKKIFKTKIAAAEGKYPIPGTETKLKPLIPCNGRLAELVVEHSSEEIFDKLDFIRVVKKGETVAKIEPATDGTPGITVLLENIPTLKGDTIEVEGKNIKVEGNKVIAQIDGSVICKSTRIDVEPVLIKDDEDIGEIKFSGSIKVMGNVESYPLIQASGDIEVYGIVSDTTLIAGRHIFVHQNLSGSENKMVLAGGDFLARNVSNAKITAENILVSSAILSSDIAAYRSVVIMLKDGKIIGGNALAGHSVSSGSIGNEKNIPTRISVATPGTMLKFREKILAPYLSELGDLKEEKEKNQRKLKQAEDVENKMGEKNQTIYKIHEKIFKNKIARNESKISDLYKEIVKIKDPKCESVTGTITSNKLYPETSLSLGIGSRKITEVKEMVRYCVKNANIYTELLE